MTILVVAVAKKGSVMEMSNKKNHLSRIRISFIMLLFAMCITMYAFFCSNYIYEFLDKTTAIETSKISEGIVANEDGEHTTYFKSSFLNKDNSHTETITKSICPILMTAGISKGFSLLLFLIIVFLFYYLTLFILLPDGWTLINHKVRLDD